ncbi:MAG: hypothetical protein HFJ28_04050 [Clostridia bacterium]|nr:hypothetical protein [Clostridia bacterium]
MLILAGITIAVVLGEGGLISTALKAKNETEKAVQNEQGQLNELNNYIANGGWGSGENKPGGEEPNPPTPPEPEEPKKDGSYEKKGDIWVNAPDLTGFIPEKTKYVNVDKTGSLVIGSDTTQKPEENWHDYENSEWANICVENEGVQTYYTWIPRYCFKLNQDEERADIKFIDKENNYKDASGAITAWAKLEEEGYSIPEAFTFEEAPLAGIWGMKYTANTVNSISQANTSTHYKKTDTMANWLPAFRNMEATRRSNGLKRDD